jgi:Domain of unknown function (DUF892)
LGRLNRAEHPRTQALRGTNVPRRRTRSSVFAQKCDEAELKGWPPFGVRNTQQQNLSKALHVRPKLDELFHDTLKDTYFAEKKILATLPKMAKAAQSPDLKKAFEKHRSETAKRKAMSRA